MHGRVRTLLTISIMLSSAAIASADVPLPGRENEYIWGKLLEGILILLIFFAITVCIELFTALAYVVVRKVTPKKKILPTVLLANAVSYPLFIIALDVFQHPFPPEAFVVLLEGAIIYKITEMSLRESMLLSSLVNLVSASFPYLFFK